jgi:hypothetical protein
VHCLHFIPSLHNHNHNTSDFLLVACSISCLIARSLLDHCIACRTMSIEIQALVPNHLASVVEIESLAADGIKYSSSSSSTTSSLNGTSPSPSLIGPPFWTSRRAQLLRDHQLLGFVAIAPPTASSSTADSPNAAWVQHIIALHC